VKITERAGIGLGTFYLYFDSKQQIFEELVVDLNRRVRHSMSEAMAGASGRIEAERAGFEGFFRFTAAHPALYRVVREAEFVSPEMLRLHYTRIVDGYEAGLRAAQQEGDVDEALDPEVTAGLMGAGELIGMRYPLWERDEQDNPPSAMPEAVIDHMTRFIRNALEPRRTSGGSHD
jgi:AcrR family transcriptional regulator